MSSPDPNEKAKLLQDIDYPHIVIADVSSDEESTPNSPSPTINSSGTNTPTGHNSQKMSNLLGITIDPNQSSPTSSKRNSGTTSITSRYNSSRGIDMRVSSTILHQQSIFISLFYGHSHSAYYFSISHY